MEEDILNCSPTVMFRGTPCSSRVVVIMCRVNRPISLNNGFNNLLITLFVLKQHQMLFTIAQCRLPIPQFSSYRCTEGI